MAEGGRNTRATCCPVSTDLIQRGWCQCHKGQCQGLSSAGEAGVSCWVKALVKSEASVTRPQALATGQSLAHQRPGAGWRPPNLCTFLLGLGACLPLRLAAARACDGRLSPPHAPLRPRSGRMQVSGRECVGMRSNHRREARRGAAMEGVRGEDREAMEKRSVED